jgi:predicted thioesterase
MALQSGLRAEVRHEVTDRDTARALGSGEVEVLGTPMVVALCERAAVQSLAGHLDPGHTSVGVRISLDHVAPTVPGRTVTATASLEAVDGRTLEFAVEACDDTGTIAKGLHTRVLVESAPFMDGAASR